MKASIQQYIVEHAVELRELVIQLCQIPAPTGQEAARAAFCKAWLERNGAKSVYIDAANNVVCPFDLTPGRPVAVFMAHLDTVFPDTMPFSVRETDGRLYCPGIFDDTANVAVMLMAIKYILRTNLKPNCGVIFAANSCEEGLGNLKGCRALLDCLGDTVHQVVSFDLGLDTAFVGAVGSARYRIAMKAAGGHSYLDFGKTNAIAEMARFIAALYQQPAVSGATYNVGKISGGTSVNTIAQHAEILYEYRADTAESMAVMEKNLRQIATEFNPEIELLGIRPGMGVSKAPAQQAALSAAVAQAVTAETGRIPRPIVGSTDCNIPFSRGIPSACVGLVRGAGAHTRQEYIIPESLQSGLGVALRLICPLFDIDIT